MKQIVPEIYVSDCRNALDFYRELFGGEIKNLQMSDDLELFRDQPGKVIHAELHVNAHCILDFVDILDDRRARTGNITILLHLDSPEEARRLLAGLRVDGYVLMELQKTFWGDWHAIVTDRFGAPWALNCASNVGNGE